MAEAVGIRGIRLEDPAEVEDGIAAALAHDGPVLVDAVVNRTELAMPPSITLEMAKGFTLYMVKAVIERPRRRGHRPREDQPLALMSREMKLGACFVGPALRRARVFMRR